MQPLVPDVERVSSPPQNRRGRPVEQRLLEVEALHEREGAEPEHEQEGDLPCAPAAAAQVEGGDDERDAGGHRQRVEQWDRVDRLDLQEQVVAPGDVRGQRREQVDEPDRESNGSGQRGQPFGSAHRAQRRGPPVEPEAPGGGVPLGRSDVAPVLEYEVAARSDNEQRSNGEIPETGGTAGEDERDQAQPEVPFVDALPEDVHARAVPVAVKADHRVCSKSTEDATKARPGSTVAQRPAARLRRLLWPPHVNLHRHECGCGRASVGPR